MKTEGKKIRVRVTGPDGKQRHLGWFHSEEAAQLARDEFRKQIKGTNWAESLENLQRIEQSFSKALAKQFLYRYYDIDNVLLYVGVTKNFEQRDKNHQKTSVVWYQFVDYHKVQEIDNQNYLKIEADCIAREQPLFNIDKQPNWLDNEKRKAEYFASKDAASRSMYLAIENQNLKTLIDLQKAQNNYLIAEFNYLCDLLSEADLIAPAKKFYARDFYFPVN